MTVVERKVKKKDVSTERNRDYDKLWANALNLFIVGVSLSLSLICIYSLSLSFSHREKHSRFSLLHLNISLSFQAPMYLDFWRYQNAWSVWVSALCYFTLTLKSLLWRKDTNISRSHCIKDRVCVYTFIRISYLSTIDILNCMFCMTAK